MKACGAARVNPYAGGRNLDPPLPPPEVPVTLSPDPVVPSPDPVPDLVPDLVDVARGLFDTIRAHAAEGERDRRLPDATREALRGAGLFGMLQPRGCGGLERPLPEVLRAMEEVARADGAAGWCLLIGAGSNALAAWLAPEAAREAWREQGTVTASVFAPSGVAVPVPGGYRVSGRWAYGSGVEHSALAMGMCRVETAEGEEGVPPLLALLPASDVRIVPNWDTLGLRGTGSHDFEATDVFVPAALTLRFTERPRVPSPLYALPFQAQLWLWFSPVPLGIARAALDEFRRVAAAKSVGGRALRDSTHVQMRFAEAEGIWRAARAFARDVADRAWATALAGEPCGPERVAEAGLMVRHAVRAAATVTEMLHDLAGGSGLREGVLARCFRDAHAATQHIALAPHVWETAGRTLLAD